MITAPQNLSDIKMNLSRIGQFCCRELNSSVPRLSSSSLSLLASSPECKRNSTLSNPNKRNSSSDSSMPKARLPPPRTFSGIQPTGVLHLGNYLGAVKGWVKGLEVGKKKENWKFPVEKFTSLKSKNKGGRGKEGFADILCGRHARHHTASKSPGAQVCSQSVMNHDS